MSIISAKTGLSSILKSFTANEREKTKATIANKVRFELPKTKGLLNVVEDVNQNNNYKSIDEFISYLNNSIFDDNEYIQIMTDACNVCNQLSPKFTKLVETLFAIPWIKRSTESVELYCKFFIDILVAHSKYVQFGISMLISLWIPSETSITSWPNYIPDEITKMELETIHKLLNRILIAIPMSYDDILKNIECKFPYYKKSTHIIAGYLHNILMLLNYRPDFREFAMDLILRKLLIFDVNAPRNKIEDAEFDEGDDDEQFQIDDIPENVDLTMKHPIAQSLDICMIKMFDYFDTYKINGLDLSAEQRQQFDIEANKFLNILLNTFDNFILPTHNTHHVQFLFFYYCNFKQTYVETFLSKLWDKVVNPNESVVIRQAAVGYIASFMARSKLLHISVLRYYLKLLCDWAHMYIRRGDQYCSNNSLKANLVFFTICQTVFYVIAFRSRDLTSHKNGLLFLQTLQLSALVTCNLNPLRVCLPAVATAFSGVTRAYQLAYCHAILERNARRKLATVYANEISTPEEVLDTFFPYDPYLLKMSEKFIKPIYLQYQATEAEEQTSMVVYDNIDQRIRRKRDDSEMIDDTDDFLVHDKRQRFGDSYNKNNDRDNFSYGSSPGFHI